MKQEILNLLLEKEDDVALLFTNLINDYYKSNFKNQNDTFENEELTYLFYLTKLGCLMDSFKRSSNFEYKKKIKGEIRLTIDKIDVLKDGKAFL